MLMEIKCSNFSGFDSATGKYVKCGETISVTDEQIGGFVQCPKCSQAVEVIATSDARELERPKQSSSGKSGAASRSKTGQQSSQRQRGSNPKPKSNPQRPSRAPSSDLSGFDDDLQLAPPLERERRDVMALDFAEGHMESELSEDKHDRCTKCGNISTSGKCTVCRHVEFSFEKRNQPLGDVKIELVGFQRWFCKTMTEGVSIKLLEYGAHASLGFIAVGLIFLSLLAICGLTFSVVGGVLLLLFTLCAASFYIGLILKGKQFLRDPNAKLAWFQLPFWNGILAVTRAMNWQAYDGNLKGRKIIKIHDKAFGDEQLATIEDLKNAQVLDLEGTRITDVSLDALYGHKHLQCLVVKGTNTSHEAVFRFQQSHPRIWIWE